MNRPILFLIIKHAASTRNNYILQKLTPHQIKLQEFAQKIKIVSTIPTKIDWYDEINRRSKSAAAASYLWTSDCTEGRPACLSISILFDGGPNRLNTT